MKKDSAFSRFWKAQGVNQIIGLVITLFICVWAGSMKLLFSTPIWIVLGLIFWGIRMRISFRNWKRDNDDDG